MHVVNLGHVKLPQEFDTSDSRGISHTMTPPAADVDLGLPPAELKYEVSTKGTTGTRLSQPLKYSGSLDEYKHFDVTSVIGREFPEVQIKDILQNDTKIRDLAITGLS